MQFSFMMQPLTDLYLKC